MRQTLVRSTPHKYPTHAFRPWAHRQGGRTGHARGRGRAQPARRYRDTRRWSTRILSGVAALIDMNLSLARHLQSSG
jgi:hypothetical protein